MKQSFTRSSSLLFCALLFILLFSACANGDGGNTASQSTNDQSLSSTPQINRSFQGKGYAIKYADAWTKSSIGVGDDVYFRDSASKYRWFHIRVENLNQFVGDDNAVVAEAIKFEYGEGSKCAAASPSVQTLAGATWARLQENCAISGTADTPSQVEIAGLATTQAQKHYIITYSATPDVFNQFDRAVFQPMLQSFTFQ